AIDLMNIALQNFQSARSSLESLLSIKPSETRMDFCQEEFTKDLQAMLRVCIANIISLHKIIDELKPNQEPSPVEDEKIKKSRKQQKKKQRQKNKPTMPDAVASHSQAQETMTTESTENKPVNKMANFEFKYHPRFPVVSLK
ncbi:15200_t:CDS:2, partial [Acaulospora morrowiae]